MIIDPRYPKVNDDVIFRLGTDSDITLVLRSTALATNTALTDVLVGTPVTPAIAANSLILSNITAGGDVLMAGNRNGNSEAFLWYDTSTGDLSLYSRGTGSFDIYDDATKIVDAVSGTWAFQQATSLTTTAGALTVAPATALAINAGTTLTITAPDATTLNAFRAMASDASERYVMQLLSSWASGSLAHFNVVLETVTLTGANPTTYDVMRTLAIGQFTYVGTNVNQTVTNPATIYISGAPIASTNVVFTNGPYAIFVDDGLSRFDGTVQLGFAGTVTGVLEIEGATSGIVTVTVAAAAGTWTMTLPTGVAGTAGFQLTDAAANGVTSWAATGSRREWKDIISIADPQDALDKILGVRVYDFRYRPGEPSTGDLETVYRGVISDEAPWAMHYGGGVLNPVNTFGYTVGAIQAMHQYIERLEARIVELESLVRSP